jgi:uncharacterized membrane protein YecN with MAPEG domain
MVPSIASVYASVLAILCLWLSVRVIRFRRRDRIAIGDGDNSELRRAVRVHANFAEYVPLALILIAFVEMGGAPPWLVNVLGASLLAGRAAHAYGVSQSAENYRFRVAGMVATFTVLASSATILLARTLSL